MTMSLLAADVDCDCVDFVVSFSSAQLRFDGVEDEEAAADDVGGPVDVGGLIGGVPKGAWLPDSADSPAFDSVFVSFLDVRVNASHRFDFSCRKSLFGPVRALETYECPNGVKTGQNGRIFGLNGRRDLPLDDECPSGCLNRVKTRFSTVCFFRFRARTL